MSSGSNGPNRRAGQKDAREIAGHPDVLPGPPFRAPSAGSPVVHGRWIHEAGGRISSSPCRRYGPARGRSTGLSSRSEEEYRRYRRAELTEKGIGGPTTLPIDDGMKDNIEDVLSEIWTEDQLSRTRPAGAKTAPPQPNGVQALLLGPCPRGAVYRIPRVEVRPLRTWGRHGDGRKGRAAGRGVRCRCSTSEAPTATMYRFPSTR